MDVPPRLEEMIRTPDRPAPDDRSGRQYLRSYLLQRLVIGSLGLLLPLVLVLTQLARTGEVLGSLSAYYYSDVGDLFVGGLVAVGLFLLAYMVFERNLDNALSLVAGAAGLLVALVPTDAPAGEVRGSWVPVPLHFVSATLFILGLAAISFLFGYREGIRPDSSTMQRRSWRAFHYLCAGIIVASCVFIALTVTWFDYSLLVGESVAVAAFGASWTAKGTELFTTFDVRQGAGAVALIAGVAVIMVGVSL